MLFPFPTTLFSGAPAGYVATANDYDGTNDFLLRGATPTGLVDGKQGVVSLWLKMTTGARMFFMGCGENKLLVERKTGGQLEFLTRKVADGATVVLLRTVATFDDTDEWIHFLTSFDAAANKAFIFINGVEDEDTGVTLIVDALIGYNRGEWAVGALASGALPTNGCLTEVYFDDSFIDISVLANREKFIKDGKPVALGDSGELPTGSSPIIYMREGDEVNSGTGGNFTVTGALVACADSPSD